MTFHKRRRASDLIEVDVVKRLTQKPLKAINLQKVPSLKNSSGSVSFFKSIEEEK